MNDTPKTPVLLTMQEVTDALKVHQRTVYRLISSGSLRAIKIGGQWRVPEDDLVAYIESGLQAATRPKKKDAPGQVQLNLPLGGE